MQKQIDNILGSLPYEEKYIIRRRYMDEEPVEQICGELHISRRTFYRRLNDARDVLSLFF